jgi:predicted DCC family thiol-disulfide oxidoreductase YuxK
MEERFMGVIFFDGVCGLCNGFVDFILKIDKKGQFKFSPLQSEYAQKNLPKEYTEDLKSVVYLKNGKLLSQTEAVIEILKDNGGVWKLAAVGKILPEFIRDGAYNMVAQNRYKMFGKKETCRLPNPEERARFVID